MSDLTISRVRVYAVTPEETPAYRFSGTGELETLHYLLVRITASNGLEGAAGALADENAVTVENGDYLRASVDHLAQSAQTLVGEPLSQHEALAAAINQSSPTAMPYALSLFEIALWDLVARCQDQPLYQLQGGHRREIPAYASSPVLDSVDDYVNYVDHIHALGYPGAKFHMQGNLDFDLEMITAVADRISEHGLFFMVDMEAASNLEDATRIGTALSTMPCTWLEAPFNDRRFDDYATLRQSVGVEVIPDGNAIADVETLAHGIQHNAWARLRCDVTNVGGISAGRAVMALGALHGMSTELQCYGFPLTQAANLHLMLGVPGCHYFEQPVPLEHYDYGAPDPLRIQADGTMKAPEGPGLGIDTDWDGVEQDAVHQFDSQA